MLSYWMIALYVSVITMTIIALFPWLYTKMVAEWLHLGTGMYIYVKTKHL